MAVTQTWLPDGMPPALGLYQIVRLLGKGGMGVVFEATHQLLHKRAALKVLRPQFARDPLFVGRFRREMAALGRVKPHPNLVAAHYADEEKDLLYLVMDFVEGADLNVLLRERGAFPPAEACEVIRQATLGLGAIQQADLVHRDLKPSNLMLARDGTVKILDLGLARLREPERPDENLTPTDLQLGTADYQAPEQADDPRRVDIRADIYSLGCALYKLLTGRAPYAEHSTPAKKLYAHAHQPFPSLGTEAPAGLDAVLARMAAKEPEGRYAIPAELAEALQPFARGAALTELLLAAPPAASAAPDNPTPSDARSHTAPRTGTPPTPGGSRRGRRFLWGSVALAAVAAAALLLHRGLQPTEEGGDNNLQAVPGKGLRQEKKGPPTDGILPLGTSPRNLNGLLPGLQHDLLAFAPVEAYWDRATGTEFRKYDPGARQLFVNAPRKAFFHLGTIQKPNFTFRVHVNQSRWTSGAGIYLGYREGPSQKPGETVATFQYFLFEERTPLKGDRRIYHVSRGRGKLAGSAARRRFSTEGVMSQDIDWPIHEQVLSLEVTNDYLRKVSVNGKELWKLAAPDVNKAFTVADYRGGLGLLSIANSSVYREANLSILGP